MALSQNELMRRHIGDWQDRTNPNTAKKWKVKSDTYSQEGVQILFRRILRSLKEILMPAFVSKNEGTDDLAHRTAQFIIDKFLLGRTDNPSLKKPYNITMTYNEFGEAEEAEEIADLVDAAIFEGKKEVSENEKIRWVYENMQRKDVKPEDAPSMGAWGMYVHYKKGPQRQEKFFDVLVPKLMTKEDAEKGGKLADDGKDALELIERLLAAQESSEGSE